jgi:PIN domain nuclease of toxin-antitoxin system
VLLLDTCTFVWLTSEPDRLSETARELLDDPSRSIVLSDVSVWELCLKWEAGKITLPSPPRTWVEEQARAWSLDRLEVERFQLYRSTELPTLHRDPFDRLLIAQALDRGLTIITPDAHIQRYPVAAAW